MRGKKEVQDFAQEMLEVLNMPHNIQKGHWADWSWLQLKEKLIEKFHELTIEIEILEASADFDYEPSSLIDMMAVTVDLANIAMMLRQNAATILVKGAKV